MATRRSRRWPQGNPLIATRRRRATMKPRRRRRGDHRVKAVAMRCHDDHQANDESWDELVQYIYLIVFGLIIGLSILSTLTSQMARRPFVPRHCLVLTRRHNDDGGGDNNAGDHMRPSGDGNGVTTTTLGPAVTATWCKCNEALGQWRRQCGGGVMTAAMSKIALLDSVGTGNLSNPAINPPHPLAPVPIRAGTRTCDRGYRFWRVWVLAIIQLFYEAYQAEPHCAHVQLDGGHIQAGQHLAWANGGCIGTIRKNDARRKSGTQNRQKMAMAEEADEGTVDAMEVDTEEDEDEEKLAISQTYIMFQPCPHGRANMPLL
ncbi:hypothetical protein EDB85DRAFT_2277561 [Lactarius pseudohatsudake]|nr:hypothetical protein EDB85DRAFT_2277561 [Lactarius pseudohatsudake]